MIWCLDTLVSSQFLLTVVEYKFTVWNSIWSIVMDYCYKKYGNNSRELIIVGWQTWKGVINQKYNVAVSLLPCTRSPRWWKSEGRIGTIPVLYYDFQACFGGSVGCKQTTLVIGWNCFRQEGGEHFLLDKSADIGGRSDAITQFCEML